MVKIIEKSERNKALYADEVMAVNVFMVADRLAMLQ